MARPPRRPRLSIWDSLALWLDLPPGGLNWSVILSTLIPGALISGLIIALLLRVARDPEGLTGYERARVTQIATYLGGEYGSDFAITADLAEGTSLRFTYKGPFLLFDEGDEICLARSERIRSGQSVFAYADDAHCADLPKLPPVEPF